MVARQEKSLTRRMFLNTVTNSLIPVATALVGFIANPYLLAVLGPSLFGTWRVCQQSLGYLADSGAQGVQALRWTIASKEASDDVHAKRQDVGSAMLLWLLFAPIATVIGALIAWYLPFFIRELPLEHFTVTRLACVVLLVSIVLSPLQRIPDALLVGTNQNFKFIGVHPFSTLLAGALMMLAAWLGWGLVGVAAALPCSLVVRGLILFVIARRNIPWLGFERPRKSEHRNYLKFSFWLLCWSLVFNLMLSGSIVVLGAVASAEAVTIYSFTQYVMLMSVTIPALLVGATIPGLGAMVGRGEYERAGRIRTEIMSGTWLVTLVLAAGILLLNESFVGLWVGAENFAGTAENILIVVLLIQWVFISCDALIIDVTLDIKGKVVLGAIACAASLGLAYIMGRVWGGSIAGVIVGTILGRSIMTFAYPLMANKVFGVHSRAQMAALARPAITMAALLAGAAYLGTRTSVTSWIELIAYGAVSSVLVLVLGLFLGLNGQQRGQLRLRMAGALNRVTG